VFHVVINILFILISIQILFIKILLNKYLSIYKNKITKNYTDTSTFYNKCNINKVERNIYFKNKKVMKLSLITEHNGILLNVDLYKGNLNDVNIFNNQLTKLDNTNFTKETTMFMEDVGYDSINLRNNLSKIFYKSIIPFNIRNSL
jgi:hypothetical protein